MKEKGPKILDDPSRPSRQENPYYVWSGVGVKYIRWRGSRSCRWRRGCPNIWRSSPMKYTTVFSKGPVVS